MNKQYISYKTAATANVTLFRTGQKRLPGIDSKVLVTELFSQLFFGPDLKQEGIFRKPGNPCKSDQDAKRIIIDIINSYLENPQRIQSEEQQENLGGAMHLLNADYDPNNKSHVAARATLTKAIFAGTANQLVLGAPQPDTLPTKASKKEKELGKIRLDKASIKAMNPQRKFILSAILTLAKSIVTQSEANKMTAENVAMVLGGTLVPSSVKSAEDFQKVSEQLNSDILALLTSDSTPLPKCPSLAPLPQASPQATPKPAENTSSASVAPGIQVQVAFFQDKAQGTPSEAPAPRRQESTATKEKKSHRLVQVSGELTPLQKMILDTVDEQKMTTV